MKRSEGFWRFSLAFYPWPGVAEMLLRLQDEAGASVNLILFALWAGACECIRLDPADITASKAAIAPLDDTVVDPLRALRRRLKSDPDADIQALRRRIAALELAAERRVQHRLAASLPARPASGDRRTAAEANLNLVLGAEAGGAEGTALHTALAAFLARG
jgi:uncharacterized protein (TIGR02444 family)